NFLQTNISSNTSAANSAGNANGTPGFDVMTEERPAPLTEMVECAREKSQPKSNSLVGGLPPLRKRKTPSACSKSRNRYIGFRSKYRLQRRRGSLEKRNSHSRPRSCIHRGACRSVPPSKGKAAPTAIIGTSSKPRNS